MLKSLKRGVTAEFYATVTRNPSVYRGNPFLVEAGIAYGGSLEAEGILQIIRFANKVPLQYQQGACAIQKAVAETAWKNYGIQQSKGSLPRGPLMIVLHFCSVWVPFTSESKEAIASYDEIVKEMKLAIQECGRKLATFVRKRNRDKLSAKKKDMFKNYSLELASSLSEITGTNEKKIYAELITIAEKMFETGALEEKNGE